ncbi:type II toxin-antitoxin system RelE/ParE family toxin [Agrobacterium larrymoorei]|uniref:type II toxin-antitoxin system RelE/ParE family toxin n=1 Tax=Agrobacterium larrymoorei TaxID=160699 RepID=UPI001573F2C4|nr:type II toxin-antitoxin system RelE/ParE family toxin [Agrobacterium larrymoorei]NTJ41536.1 type II toxin-antitoxin system RelE/ParE family toxin [Agrobacterium larrymoorei]
MRWSVETHNAADLEIEALPVGLQARLIRLMEAVENVGLEQLREPHVKHLEGKLWELRAKASEGIARGIYVTMSGRRVIVLHVFVKKSQKTPKSALAIARQRMSEINS